MALIHGNVAWASSSSPGERLGEVACRMGLVERSRLQQILGSERDPLDRRRIGQVLVDSGAMQPQDLPRVVRQQVVEIFLGLLVARSGAFVFLRAGRMPSSATTCASRCAVKAFFNRFAEDSKARRVFSGRCDFTSRTIAASFFIRVRRR